MKNAFKFGFLGLALTIGLAACNSTKNESDNTADSLESVIEGSIEADRDSLRAADTIDSIGADSLVVDTNEVI